MNSEIDFNQLHRDHYGQLVATLTSSIGDLTLAEEFVQDAFATAMTTWPRDGTPESPRAWLNRTSLNRAIDHMRRKKHHRQTLPDIAYLNEIQSGPEVDTDLHPALRDDMLRLIFCCCHPALSMEARVALALRIVCGLETQSIADAFIVPEATMAQRLVRAKQKISNAGIGWRIPEKAELDERTNAVLAVIYLVFNKAWSQPANPDAMQCDLAETAIQMGRNLVTLLPGSTQTQALLALMLLQHSRRRARFDGNGDTVLLEFQDRSLWDRANIAEGKALVHHLFDIGQGNSSYAIQAAIAAMHSDAVSSDNTDWTEICTLYEYLMDIDDSDVVQLNYAVALCERDGPVAALRKIDQLLARGKLENYHLLHSTQANFLRRNGQMEQANAAYKRALELASNETDRKFLRKQLH